MRNKFVTLAFALAWSSLPVSAPAQIATGGSYALEQAVIATGGGSGGGGTYGLEGTAGQPAAGVRMLNPPYVKSTGFWTAPPFAPTAARVIIAGRVLRPDGSGLSGARITLSGVSLAVPVTAVSGSFGYFAIDGIEVGHFYSLGVHHRQYQFEQSTYTFTLVDERNDFVFVASLFDQREEK